jgi:3-methyladenine DNA glycosylase AlkD
MNSDALALEIRGALKAAAGGREPRVDTTFNKPGGEWVSFGLGASELRAVTRGFRPRIKDLSLDERLDLAEALLADGSGEMGHAGIDVLALTAKELGPEHFVRLDAMLDDFRGWSHVDDFCISVAQPLLLAHPEETLAQLRAWNTSPNRWKRRTSVVTFVRKVGESGRFTDEALELCEPLVRDPEDLVLKGVGWCLKDVMRGDRPRVLAYVKELRGRGVSSVVTLYAIRDLKGEEREAVLAVRSA